MSQPQDFNAQNMAAPIESREQSSSPFQHNGASLPGVPSNEMYQAGQDYNGLASLDGFTTGINMGGLGVQNVYPISDPFADQQPAYAVGGFDSQKGINTGAIPVSFSNQNMYWDGTGVVSFHDVNAQPELQGYSPMEPANTDE